MHKNFLQQAACRVSQLRSTERVSDCIVRTRGSRNMLLTRFAVFRVSSCRMCFSLALALLWWRRHDSFTVKSSACQGQCSAPPSGG
jgi:hypothetical protein